MLKSCSISGQNVPMICLEVSVTHDQIPVLQFVTQMYSSRSVQKIVEFWRIEPAQVIEKITDHFREMGIYRVNDHHQRLLLIHMLHLLRHSPEIQRMAEKASFDEARRQRSRHSE
jgi:hypothetical protein